MVRVIGVEPAGARLGTESIAEHDIIGNPARSRLSVFAPALGEVRAMSHLQQEATSGNERCSGPAQDIGELGGASAVVDGPRERDDKIVTVVLVEVLHALDAHRIRRNVLSGRCDHGGRCIDSAGVDASRARLAYEHTAATSDVQQTAWLTPFAGEIDDELVIVLVVTGWSVQVIAMPVGLVEVVDHASSTSAMPVNALTVRFTTSLAGGPERGRQSRGSEARSGSRHLSSR